MIFFQTPRVPEVAVSADDFHVKLILLLPCRTALLQVFEKGFWGRHGLKNKRNFTEEDMEAWKYTFSQPGWKSLPEPRILSLQ